VQFYQIRAPPATKQRGAVSAPLTHVPPTVGRRSPLQGLRSGFDTRRGLQFHCTSGARQIQKFLQIPIFSIVMRRRLRILTE
jgi:hypothetical protein